MMNPQSLAKTSLLAPHEALTGTETSLSPVQQNGAWAVHQALDRMVQELSSLLWELAQIRARRAHERELQAGFEAMLCSMLAAAVLGGVVGGLLR